MTNQEQAAVGATGRRPGRPPQTDAEATAAREHILTATSAVFAEQGTHGTSVARIIETAQIARPTFYRYFRNTDEALGIVLSRIGRSIAASIGTAVAAVDGDLARTFAGIEGYLGWGRQNRELLRSLYVGAHDPQSPVYSVRPILLRQLTELINDEIVAGGRPALDDWTIDLLLNAMEYACYRLYLDGDPGEQARADARATMIRTAVALLGRAADWQRVLAVPEIRKQLFEGR